MSCDAILDRVSASITQGETLDVATQAHVASCPRCSAGAAELAALWDELGHLPTPQADAARLAETIQLAEAMMNQNDRAPEPRQRRRKPWVTVTWVSFALVVGVWVGYSAQGLSGGGALSSSDETQYLLLLHGTAITPPAEDAPPVRISDYQRWAQQLTDGGHLVSAQKLTDDTGRWLAPAALPDDRPAGLPITGYFIVRAASYDEAVRLAHASPHLRHGGFIEVRAIENTDP